MERMKLIVKTVNPVREVGEHKVPLLEFNAENGGATYQYQSFRKSIFEFIKTGAVIDVDVEIGERDYGGQHYTDRKVVQLYQNGQPVGGQKQGFGGGYHSKTPEEIAFKRKSIEEQTAFKGGVELIISGNATPEVTSATENWLLTKLHGEVGIDWDSKKKPSKPPDKPQVSQLAKKTEQVVETPTPKQKSKPKRDAATITDWGKLCTACKEDFKLSREAVLKECGVTAFSQLSGIDEQSPSACYIAIAAVRG